MTNSIQCLPRELLGDTFLNLNNPNDIVGCTLVCKDWYETIKTNSVSKKLIENFYSDADLGTVIQIAATINFNKEYYYDLLKAFLNLSEYPLRLNIQSKEINDLNTIANEFESMGNANYHPEYLTKVSARLDRLPIKIQQKLYKNLEKACQGDAAYDYSSEEGRTSEWGTISFHSSDARRNLPSYFFKRTIVLDQIGERKKREVLLQQLGEQKLYALGWTVMHDSSEINKRAAIEQLSQFPVEIKEGIYQELRNILDKNSTFENLSGKEAFYDIKVPQISKGAAIMVYINTKLRQLQ